MSTPREQTPSGRQPLRGINGFQSQSFHPDLSILTTVFTGQGSPRPYTESSSVMPISGNSNNCQQLNCPLRFPHPPGLYQHLNQPSPLTDIRPHFGSSNPPPEIWMARLRILNNRGSEADFTSVAAFIRAHYVEWTNAERQQRQEQPAIDDGSPPSENKNEDEDQDVEMEDLTEEMADVEIKQNTDNTSQARSEIFTTDPPASINNNSILNSLSLLPVYSPRTEAEIDRQIDRQLEEAFLELELEEAQEAAARMEITDDADKENDAPPQQTHSPPPPPPPQQNGLEYEQDGRPLQELMEEAHRICVDIREELARDDDDDDIL
ncbi:MAG: hypothetical protein Q9188_002696 [Gyalolechia gomerana]